MPNYDQRMHEIARVRSAVYQECERARRELGRAIVTADRTSWPESVVTRIREYQKLHETIATQAAASEQAATIAEEQQALETEARELRSALKQSERDAQRSHARIGEVAFRLFREHPLVDASYTDAFEQLARYHDELRRLEQDAEHAAPPDGDRGRGILDRIATRGRDVLVRNRLATKRAQLPRLLEEAGSRLAQGDFIDQIDDADLNDAAVPVRTYRDKKLETDTRLRGIEDRKTKLEQQLTALIGTKPLQRARKAIEQEINDAKAQANDLLLDIGRAAEGDRSEAFAATQSTLSDCEQRRRSFDELMARLQAGKRAELLKVEIDDIERRQEILGSRIKELQSELKSLKGIAKERAAEREEQLTQRGDETELFDE